MRQTNVRLHVRRIKTRKGIKPVIIHKHRRLLAPIKRRYSAKPDVDVLEWYDQTKKKLEKTKLWQDVEKLENVMEEEKQRKLLEKFIGEERENKVREQVRQQVSQEVDVSGRGELIVDVQGIDRTSPKQPVEEYKRKLKEQTNINLAKDLLESKLSPFAKEEQEQEARDQEIRENKLKQGPIDEKSKIIRLLNHYMKKTESDLRKAEQMVKDNPEADREEIYNRLGLDKRFKKIKELEEKAGIGSSDSRLFPTISSNVPALRVTGSKPGAVAQEDSVRLAGVLDDDKFEELKKNSLVIMKKEPTEITPIERKVLKDMIWVANVREAREKPKNELTLGDRQYLREFHIDTTSQAAKAPTQNRINSVFNRVYDFLGFGAVKRGLLSPTQYDFRRQLRNTPVAVPGKQQILRMTKAGLVAEEPKPGRSRMVTLTDGRQIMVLNPKGAKPKEESYSPADIIRVYRQASIIKKDRKALDNFFKNNELIDQLGLQNEQPGVLYGKLFNMNKQIMENLKKEDPVLYNKLAADERGRKILVQAARQQLQGVQPQYEKTRLIEMYMRQFPGVTEGQAKEAVKEFERWDLPGIIAKKEETLALQEMQRRRGQRERQVKEAEAKKEQAVGRQKSQQQRAREVNRALRDESRKFKRVKGIPRGIRIKWKEYGKKAQTESTDDKWDSFRIMFGKKRRR
jgi:hypothetical protein